MTTHWRPIGGPIDILSCCGKYSDELPQTDMVTHYHDQADCTGPSSGPPAFRAKHTQADVDQARGAAGQGGVRASGKASLPDDYVGFALVGQVNGHGSLHVVWVSNRVGSRAAAWPPDGITSDETWATAEPLYTAAARDARVASEAAEKALRDAAHNGSAAFAATHRDPWARGRQLVESRWLTAEADRIAAERAAS